MNTSTHGAHLVKLTRLGAVNVFLVREEDGFTLVDTGVKGSGRAIVEGARAAGGEIARIVLTHGHSDHAGSLDELHALLPDVPVLVGAREARLMDGDRAMEAGEPPLGGGRIVRTTTRPTTLLSPGDRVGSLEVHRAPGHTPGQIALLDPRERTLIAGDAWVTLGGMQATGKAKWPFPFPTMASWHRPTALATARELRGLDPARLAVGHGPVVESPGAAMDRALAAAGA
ncbi:MBL fold metallo-hydrolase [Conexibacter arvalis]|uniref:Glyoxylase-like metal-dependent hydrolase (Beta-lactamase superfamily II) n=1 Tax=Conexibacter arvalis TaxID=912552 RepID=A0A840IFQ8_9ACTN|nr:MBL fold metallo-hydrolase [Conexibacter arvalis]MBB4663692.1 glyoxylase-like metal-dependent hydrolase (beta-lactamase superfamily II) [Conexibacter arvalis]